MWHSRHASTRINTRRWTRGLLRRHLYRAGLWRRLLLTPRPLARRLLAEFVGTALLVTTVVGSGIAAERLSAGQAGLQLLENSTATALGLAVLILTFGPVSGGHFNPVISAIDWVIGHRSGSGLPPRDLGGYAAAQLAGGVAGAVLANLMFELPAVELATTERSGAGIVFAEVVATAGLVTVVFALARNGLAAWSAPAVGAYIGAAYWFTSSTSFANPAVTVGRMFSDTFAGIAPVSVPPFLAAQAVGGLVGAALVRALYPDVAVAADDVVVPHEGPHNGGDR
jgi:glycerol uptake facilitator-like aquaporin